GGGGRGGRSRMATTRRPCAAVPNRSASTSSISGPTPPDGPRSDDESLSGAVVEAEIPIDHVLDAVVLRRRTGTAAQAAPQLVVAQEMGEPGGRGVDVADRERQRVLTVDEDPVVAAARCG